MNNPDVQLYNFLKFYDAYKEYRDSGMTQVKSYEEVEKRFKAVFGTTRYSSFKSFRQCLRQKTVKNH